MRELLQHGDGWGRGGGGAGTTSTTTSGSGGSTTTTTTSTSGSGGGATCLEASLFSQLFTIADASFCAVAMYTTDESLGSEAPSWGTHGGPLMLVPDATGGGVTLERWTAPSGTMGALTKQSTHVAAGIPNMAYLGAQANDLPFFGWTTISWTGPGSATTGEILAISGGAVVATYMVNGPFGLAGVSGGAAAGRLLYTGLSPLGAPTTNVNGLYAADACSMPMQELGAGTGCAASAVVSAWDEDSGPLALDGDGNAFVVLTSASAGTQEARGFAAKTITSGAAATMGATLFTIPGYGTSLAAIAPTASAPGVLVFQPNDDTTGAALPVVEQLYTVPTAVSPSGQTSTMLDLPTGSAGLSFMTDPMNRLWVASSGTSSTTYVVLDRKP